MLIYPVVVHRDEGSDFGVMVPDLPGCVSAGETADEAIVEIHEAIYTHLEGMVMDGEDIPQPTVTAMSAYPEEYLQGNWGEGGVVCLGMAFIDPNKISPETERFNVVLPKWLAEKMSQFPENRSEFLTKAATEEVQKRLRA